MRSSLLNRVVTRMGRGSFDLKMQGLRSVAIVLLAPILVALTYIIMGPLDYSGTPLVIMLLADFTYVMLILTLIVQNVIRLVLARRAHSAGSRLHSRLSAVFALVALIPSVLVAIFAVLSINIGLEGWFSERVRNAVDASLQAATAYAQEHRRELSRDAKVVATFLNQQQKRRRGLMTNGELRQVLGSVQGEVEYLISETFIVDGTGEIMVRGGGSYDFDFERPDLAALDRARYDELVIIEDQVNSEFRALMRLTEFPNHYLQVTRVVDGEILNLLDETKDSVTRYEEIEQDRGRLLFEFGLIYLGFAMILVLAAVWLAMQFAERLSRPIGRLLSASQRVGDGDLDVRVPEENSNDEVALLGYNFNQMTSRLREQRSELLARTSQIEARRRQFDMVLSSVTSGVVGLDAFGQLDFVNRSAQQMLDISGEWGCSEWSAEHFNQGALVALVPEFGALFEDLRSSNKRQVQGQVSLLRNGRSETLLVRMALRDGGDGEVEGYVVAFDDVTDLVSAQRMAAWGDVARRIAHEIKNPLTPIQLSAERIKRKFRTQVSDVETLEQMTDVIVRQTNDLRRIVDEFSKFARMPEPDKRSQDVLKILSDVVVLQQSGQPDVRFDVSIPPQPVSADIDGTMISQAFTNLVKNAGEAIESKNNNGTDVVGEIIISAVLIEAPAERCKLQIVIGDNGIGLPEDRSKLFEPYVTTRDKGTGLGLPIVKKIIEDHGGTLALRDGPTGGAEAVVELPVLADKK